MDTLKKLEILSAAARYDVSCSSSGTHRQVYGALGSTSQAGICHSWSDDGRCISLLKVLFTNYCIYDCVYCLNRRSNDIQRASFTPEELIELTISFYRRNYIEGLFLSSAVMKSPDFTMEQLLRVVMRLRLQHRFYGYIHLKAIPGASRELIYKAGLYSDRMSINIELPSKSSLCMLASEKDYDAILGHINFIGKNVQAHRELRKRSRKAPAFVPAGQSTQLIVGASPESDLQILRQSEMLYKRHHLKRVYYSAYCHINNDSRLPTLMKPPLLREHRLYQADWLIRLYGFTTNDILNEDTPYLDEKLDPKMQWALRNPQFFPVEVNRADYETLLRVPGIGLKSAKRIISSRRFASLRPETLSRLGVVMRRAKYFILCDGKTCIDKEVKTVEVIDRLGFQQRPPEQLSLF